MGVDQHDRYCEVLVTTEKGEKVKRARIPNDGEAMRSFISKIGTPVKAVLEAGPNWEPTFDLLEELAEEVKLAHPLKVRAIASARIKTDGIDAETLAHLLRADLIPEAYVPPKEIRDKKRIIRQRLFLVALRTMVKNRIHARLKREKISPPQGLTDLFGKKGLSFLDKVLEEGLTQEPAGTLLKEDLELLLFLEEKVRKTDGLIESLAEEDKVVSYLKSVPGIGSFFSVLVRYEIGQIERFPSEKKLSSYAGLIPSTYASGERVVHGRITKQGNKFLRWALVEAAIPAIRSSPSLRVFYQKIKRRHGAKGAKAAVARKLLKLVYAVWTEKRLYRENREEIYPRRKYGTWAALFTS